MSEFLAEARILVRPDTTRFRAQLQEEVNRAISAAQITPLQVPIVLAGGQALGGVTAQTAALVAAQQAAEKSTLGLASAAQVENSALGRQAVILEAVSAATTQKAGADVAAAAAARTHAAGQSQVGKAAVASTAGMLGLRGAVLTAGTAFIAATVGFQALGKAISSAIDFERELNVFAVTAGATADEMERVGEVARELGRDITLPGVSASDAAQALQLLARAGLSVNDSLGAVRGTLQLATAAEIENARAAELVANALNSFRLEGDQASRVADLLAGAAAQSQGSIEDMGLALRQSAAIASGLGITLEDTVTILTQLARAGLSSSDAGTSFRQTLLRLIQDLPKVNAAVEELGLNLRDAQGNIRVEVFEELGKKLKSLAPAVRQKAIADLGGADAIRTYLTLTRAQAGEFDTINALITENGIAQEQAAARTKGLGGDVEATKNQFADLGITVGQVASGPLSLLVRTAGEAAGAVNDLAQAARETDQGFGETAGNFFNRFEQTFARINFQFRQGVRGAHEAGNAFNIFGAIADAGAKTLNDFADALERAGRALLEKQGLPAEGLNPQQVLNRLAGFDEQVTLARIRGDSTTIVAALEAEQAFLESQLQRVFVQNREPLRRQLQDALLGVTNELSSISKTAGVEKTRVASELATEQRNADQALIAALSNRREDIAVQAAGAAAEENVAQQIRLADRLQALIKQQILKIRAQVQDEKLRKDAIRQLRLALIASRREEEALRAERAQEAQDRRDEIQNLNIAIAEESGNDARIKKAINARIKTLNDQIDAAKGDRLKVKQLTLERARLRNQLKELNEEDKKTGEDARKTAAQFFFEQLQTQQGFASNLLGNLITGPTAGLVGVPPPTPGSTGLGSGVGAAAALQEGKNQTGPTAGQAQTTNAILQRILAALIDLNRNADTPEAVQNKRAGSAVMDGIGGGSGSSSVM